MPELDDVAQPESPLPDYLGEFLGQFLTDPRRVNPEMVGEFLREFYLWAARRFPTSREYADSQLKQIDAWRRTLQDQAGG